MHVIITCKYEKGGIKTAEKKWQHRFLDAQGQVTLWSVVGSHIPLACGLGFILE